VSIALSRRADLLTVITSLRIAAVPVVMALVLVAPGDDAARAAAAGLFVVAALTDFADGYLARRWRLTTTLGSFLDTTADKLLVSGALIALVDVGRASPWVAVIIIGRELVIMGLRGLVAADGVILKPSIWGKLKANVQFVAITLAILPGVGAGPMRLDEWLMWAAGAITVVSAIDYLMSFSSALRQSDSGRARP
jgi:CDP-diacylglycerol---glycerol-3-phosphate 3-phosphatidyltransferase